MKTLHKKRLLKLAKHLRSGKLGHKKFDFRYLNAEIGKFGSFKEKETNGCGALGCAIGEMPFVFPRTIGFFKGEPLPRLRSWRISCRRFSYYPSFKMAQDFFGISNEESSHLFVPSEQVKAYGGRLLGPRAKPSSVAANIEAFVKRKEKEAAK